MSTTPSLALIPSGYKASKLYSVLPIDGSGDFTVSRASKKHRVNSDLELEILNNNIPALNYDAIGGCPVLNTEPQATNLITYPISFGNSYWTKSGAGIEGDPSTVGTEEVVNGDFATDTDWIKGTGITISGGSATSSTGGIYILINQTTSIAVGRLYQYSFNVTITSGDIRFGDEVLNWSNTATSSGIYSGYATAAHINIYFTSPSSNFVGSINSISIKEVQGYSAPSVDFPTSAFKLVEDSATSEHRIERRISAASTNDHTLYVYAKANTRDRITIQNFDNITQYAGATFDLLNGVVVGTILGSAEIKSMADGWYKCSVTGTPPTTNLGYQEIALAESTHAGSFLDNYLGDGTSGVYIFMAQFEQSSAATSPTFTDTTLAAEGTTTQRLADVVSKTGVTSIIGQTEGSFFIDCVINSDDNATSAIINTTNSVVNSISVSKSNSTGVVSFAVYANSILEFQILTGNTYNVGDRLKILAIYKSGESRLFVNGIKEVSSSATFSFSAPVDGLIINDSVPYFGFQQVNNCISVEVRNSVDYTDAEAIAKTTL